MCCGAPMCPPPIGHFATRSCKNSLLVAQCELFVTCHFVLFYLWHHHTSRFYNLSWNNMCDIWIVWTMTNGRNLRLIIASNALWCTHVSPIYWTFSHLKLQRVIFSGILWIFVVINWSFFICGATTRWGFATSLVTPCVRFKLDEQWSMVITFI